MRLLLFIIFNFTCSVLMIAQIARVQVQLTPEHNLFTLARLGIDVSHGEYVAGRHFTCEFSVEERAKMQAAGFSTKTLIADVVQWNKQQNSTTTPKASTCNTPENTYPTPTNFQLGSMAGYYTYAELLAILDDMHTKYPNLISAKQPVGTIETHDGNSIYWLRISDNPTQDESEPEVFYNAVHHAREPAGMTQLVHYMWYLLENYATDDEVKWLVDNTEMYFMPCINPDGYLYNQATNPNGSGFWRKNRRNNGNGNFGVDLNRNYGHEWAYDNTGSSPSPSSNTYRGTSAFSEPETQAVRDFCNQHEFQIALNYHTFGNLLIHPWGYSDTDTPDKATFDAITDILTLENNYTAGTGTETVGYVVNGDSDDWMYGETATKPKIYALTPEVGTSFWPAASEIPAMNQATMWQNLMVARLPHVYGEVTDLTGKTTEDLNNNLDYTIQRFGLQEGALTVSLTGLSSNVQSTGDAKTYQLAANSTQQDRISYTLDPAIRAGDEFQLELAISNGTTTRKQTITKIYEQLAATFTDNATNLDQWTVSNQWNTTTDEFFSAPSSITDSPNGDYVNFQNTTITTTNSIDLTNASTARLQYRAKWDIESNFDYAQIQIAVNSNTFVSICGEHTNLAAGNFQPAGEPLYDGQQNNWVMEDIDLMPYVEGIVNPQIKVRFHFRADNAVTADGFYFDDVKVIRSAVALAVDQVDLQTEVVDNQVELNWNIGDLNAETIIIEHSTDGKNFQTLAAVAPVIHHFTHRFPRLGNNYYRLRLVTPTGQSNHSAIQSATLDPTADLLITTTESTIFLERLPLTDATLNIRVFSNDGRLLTQRLQVTDTAMTLPLPELATNILLINIQIGQQEFTRKILL